MPRASLLVLSWLHLGAARLLQTPVHTPAPLTLGDRFSSRRPFLLAASSALLQLRTGWPSAASESTESTIATGVVRVTPELAPPQSQTSALYVTCRLNPQANVPRYVTGGKVPPLAAARFAAPSFPFSFELRTSDLTPEFANVPQSEWIAQDLVISARWDTDGVAATRDPGDLVGRGLLSKRKGALPSKWEGAADIELQGRGLTGRLLTGGK